MQVGSWQARIAWRSTAYLAAAGGDSSADGHGTDRTDAFLLLGYHCLLLHVCVFMLLYARCARDGPTFALTLGMLLPKAQDVFGYLKLCANAASVTWPTCIQPIMRGVQPVSSIYSCCAAHMQCKVPSAA